MDIIKKLKLPDYLSFIALFFAWVSIILVISGLPNWAIMVNMIAFTFDILDGFWARKLYLDSSLGRQIDSFVDIFTYLVFSSFLYYKYLSPTPWVGVIIGFIILLFGGLRLIRFNNEGILKDTKEQEYYRGVTVVHINFAVIFVYFLSRLTPLVNLWLLAVLLLLLSVSMLSNIKSYKIKSYPVFGLIITLTVILSIFLEYAH